MENRKRKIENCKTRAGVYVWGILADKDRTASSCLASGSSSRRRPRRLRDDPVETRMLAQGSGRVQYFRRLPQRRRGTEKDEERGNGKTEKCEIWLWAIKLSRDFCAPAARRELACHRPRP